MQKYIEQPLLYKDRKFDIRIWVLVTSKLEIYMFKRGYIRTSSNKYTLENYDNFIHLTNNCLQIHGDGYGIHEDGNTLPFETIEEYYREKIPRHRLQIRNPHRATRLRPHHRLNHVG